MPLDRKILTQLIIILAIVIIFWDTILLYPLKVMVVMFHEFSHGIAAVITGGSIIEIRVTHDLGGLCISSGGSRFVTLTAGYLGSLVWGGCILVAASRTKADDIIIWVIGIFMIVMALLYVRPFASFGFIFVCITGAGLIAAGEMLSERANDLILKVIGLTSCLYAILDIKSDILDRPYLRSDAVMLAEEIGGHAILWGLAWIAVGLVASVWFLRIASTPNKRD